MGMDLERLDLSRGGLAKLGYGNVPVGRGGKKALDKLPGATEALGVV